MNILSKFRLMVGMAGLMMLGAGKGEAQANFPVFTDVHFGNGIGVQSVKLATTTPLTFRITNPGPGDLTGINFSSPLPAGLLVSTTLATGNCGVGVPISIPGSGTVGANNFNLLANTFCTFTIHILGDAAGMKTFTAGPLKVGPDANTLAAGSFTTVVHVVAPPMLTKFFSPPAIFPNITRIPKNGTTTLTFTLQNPSINSIPFKSVSLADNFDPNLKVSGTPNFQISANCTTAVFTLRPLPPPSDGGVVITMENLDPGVTCTFSVDVIGVVPGQYQNFASVTTSNGGTASADKFILIVGPPLISKVFSSPTGKGIKLNDNITLKFTIENPNVDAGADLTGINFTDSLPAAPAQLPSGLEVVSSSKTCNGTLNTTLTTIGLTGASLPPNGNCTVTVVLKGTTRGLKINTTSVVGSTDGGPGLTASDAMSVLFPPTLAKKFLSTTTNLEIPSIPQNGVAIAEFTITNPNVDAPNPPYFSSGTLTNVSFGGGTFMDVLPLGMKVAAAPATTLSCTGTFVAGPGTGTISVAIPIMLVGTSCKLRVAVTGMDITPNPKINTSTATATNSGEGDAASATLLIVLPPNVSKSFLPTIIPRDGVSTLTIPISNPSLTATLTGIGFTDTFPTGMTVVTAASNNGCGGSLLGGQPGDTFVKLTNGTLSSGASCSITVVVASTIGGVLSNSTGPVTSNEGGNGGPGLASLTVISPPVIEKLFLENPVLLNGVSHLQFKISNPPENVGITLTGIFFNDIFPADLTVVAPTTFVACGGNVNAGGGFVSLTAGSLAPGAMCTFAIDTTPSTDADKLNSVKVSSLNGGMGNTSSDTLHIIKKLILIKVFSPISIPLNNIPSTLTFTLKNPLSTGVTNVVFTDTLPIGLTASPTGTSSICGGTLVVTTGTISFSAATWAANTTCLIPVMVTGNTAGLKHNISSTINSDQTMPGDPAIADLTVVAPAILFKTFANQTILVGDESLLTINVSNPNSVTLTGLTLTDALPANLFFAPTPNFTSNCVGASIVGNTIQIVGGSLVPSPGIKSPCTITVKVTSNIIGDRVNIVTSSSTNGGTSAPAQATLHVITTNQPPVLIKAFATKFVLPGGVVALTFTLSNPSAIQITNVGFTDVLPGGFLVTNPNGLVNTCGGVAVATPTTPNISLSGVTMLPGASCTLTLNVTAPNIVPPVYICNTTSTVTWSGAPPDGDPATTCITVGDKPIAPPDAFQIRYAAHLDQGDSYINLTNNGANGAPYAGPGFGYPVGNICVNAYVFSPDEQLISCCSCLVTPNGLNSLSVKLDLVSNTLTGLQPNSVVIKLLASQPVGPVCNAALPNMMNLAPGMNAWGTTIHQTPTLSYTTTETPFIKATLSDQELASITNRCANNIGNGSGFGICRSCRAGGFAPIPIAGLPENR